MRASDERHVASGKCKRGCGRPLSSGRLCRPCLDEHAARSRARRAKEPERVRAQVRASRARDPEKTRAQARALYAKNPQRYRDYFHKAYHHGGGRERVSIRSLDRRIDAMLAEHPELEAIANGRS